MKNCSKCGEQKPLDQFQRHSQSKDGRRPDCKVCFELQHKKYRAQPKVKERIAAYMVDYQKNMPPEQRKRAYASARRATAKSPRMALWVGRNNAFNRRPSDNFISLNELMEMWTAQKGKCALSGIEMTWQRGGIKPTSISLDRIDSSKGYEPDNVRLVCFSVNAFKNTMTDEQMFTMALALVANMKRPKLRLVS
jgi:hypothetical protein